MPSRHLAAGVAGGSDADRETGVGSIGIGIGATTIPTSAEGGAGVVSGAATGDDDGLAAAVMADAVMVDLGVCATLGAATAEDGPAAAATAGVLAAGASGGGCGLMAVRCVRDAGLRPFVCAANCRAASRVRQYPAA
jgi:hypothetical protein